MSNIHVYKMNEYEWWASKLSIEETIKFYEEEIGEKLDIDDVEECDLDKEGVWWATEEPDDLERLGDSDNLITGEIINENIIKRANFGDLMRSFGVVYKYISLREAIERSGEYIEPFCIAATEW